MTNTPAALESAEMPEREAFEKFAQNCPMDSFSVTRKSDGYWSSHTQIMWDTWRAAIAQHRAAQDGLAESLLPHAYLLAKLAMVMPLFQEARDALPAITEAQRKLHGLSLTLADRMDIAGTFSLDDWTALPADPLTTGEAP